MAETNNLASLLRDFAQGASNSVASNVGVPVDILAWMLRKGGVNVPSNPVGGTDWMAEKGLTREPQNKLAGTLGDLAGFVAPFAAASKAPQIARGLLAVGENLPVASAGKPANFLPNRKDQRGAIVLNNGESAAPAFNYPQSEALKLAQQRAALPASEGGLGLPANNTAMDRANVMFPEKVYHGTNADIKAPSYEFSGKGNDQYGSAALYTATDPSLASGYVKPDIIGGNVMPLRASTKEFIDAETIKNLKPQEIKKIMKQSPELEDALWNFGDLGRFSKDKVLNDAVKTHASYQDRKILDNLNTIGNDIFPNSPEALNKAITNTLGIKGVSASTSDGGKIHAIWNPDDIRSQFAAFDPWRRNAAIAASMGVAAPDLLANPLNDENNRLIDILRKK